MCTIKTPCLKHRCKEMDVVISQIVYYYVTHVNQIVASFPECCNVPENGTDRCSSHTCKMCLDSNDINSYNNNYDVICNKHICQITGCTRQLFDLGLCYSHFTRKINVDNNTHCHFDDTCHYQTSNNSLYCHYHKCQYSGCKTK